MVRTRWFRAVIRIAPLVLLLIVVVYQRIPTLAAPRPAKVVSAAGLGDFSSCINAAHSFLSSIEKPEVSSTQGQTRLLDITETRNIASRVLARSQNDWLVGVYKFTLSSLDQIVSTTGETVDIWWLVTGNVTSDRADGTYRTWRSELTFLYLDAVTGEPLLLVDKVSVEFRQDARFLVAYRQPCETADDVLPPDFHSVEVAIRVLPLFLFALYCLGWFGFYVVRKTRQRRTETEGSIEPDLDA